MLTEKDYCDYDTCVALKELGYNGTVGECSHFGAFYMDGKEIFYDRLYNSELKENECLRVPLYLAQKWLREEKDMNVYVKAFNGEGWYYIIQNYKGARIYPPLTRLIVLCHSYEEALLEGIKQSVKILKEK